jgi:hypothetical protein
MSLTTYPAETRWRFTSPSGTEKLGTLSFYWELPNDWITDDETPDTATADELLEQWLRWLWDAKPFDEELGVPHLPIRWSVHGEDSAAFETAPSLIPGDRTETFETVYSHPEDAETEEPINWLRVPVQDKLWRPGRGNKGGFIQEATGFKPAALQPTFDLRVLGAASLDWSDRSS